METIWKFETPLNERFSVKMPKDAEILSVQIDGKSGMPCIWAKVWPQNEQEERYFELFGTGEPIHNGMGINRKYIGTYQFEFGRYIVHLFERVD